MTERLSELKQACREYQSARDRLALTGTFTREDQTAFNVLAHRVAVASVRYLADKRRRREKENKRRGIGPDDLKRLRLAEQRKESAR